MKRENLKGYLPIVFLFIILNALILVFKSFWETNGFDREFLIWSNLFLFLLSIGGYLLQRRGLKSPNPQAFVRGVYASMMFKLFLVIAVVLIYFLLFKNSINKPGLFMAMGLYIVYTVVEVTSLMKVAKNKNA